MAWPRVVLIASLLAAVLAASWLALDFQRELRVQRQRIAGAGARVIDTPCGAIEVTEAGPPDGAALLMIHGTGGGFDQGLMLGAEHAAHGWRVIAPSRFGYLGTPMPPDASSAAQADQLVCLLDALGVADAGVAGVSAGALSAVQFAIRHPQRTRALILQVPATWRPGPALPPPWAERTLRLVLGADFPFWFTARWLHGVALRSVLGTPPAQYARASAAEQRRADRLLMQILPVSERAAGVFNDARQTARPLPMAFEAITAPTLVISARDDGFDTYAAARHAASQICGARFVGFDSGGHALLGHQAEVVAATEQLLRDSGSAPAPLWLQPE